MLFRSVLPYLPSRLKSVTPLLLYWLYIASGILPRHIVGVKIAVIAIIGPGRPPVAVVGRKPYIRSYRSIRDRHTRSG